MNFFFLLLIIRSGWAIHAGSARGFWTPRARLARGPFPAREQGERLSLGIWWHVSLDALWLVNGVVFFVLLFATGQWMRLVPLHWDVFPNAISVAIQYASLEWPLENGWVNYNGLQLIAYFVTVFIAAPLAVITGLRTFPTGLRINRFPISVPAARKLHFYVMVWFVAFTFVHLVLVFATGALNNLNHMYAGRNDDNWVGFWIFAVSMVVAIVGWIAVTPFTIRFLASLSGKVTR
ncbi:cytochrome b/b6 domain-containing protein [Cryobacterium sp. Y50]|uniref:cytochrome b/b6 domain-containing protein n=1 Tax=Cryobacterium sp. Y50 TaxID=2048286 RepID=UPI0035190030